MQRRDGESRRAEAGLSVFFALISVLIAALILAAAESVRTQAARTYLTAAAGSAADSLFSQYHLELWENYRLLGLEMYSDTEAVSEFGDFLKPYTDPENVKNWYALSIGENDITLYDHCLITDRNGEVFEDEVVDYMKYGIAASVMELADMKSIGVLFKDGGAVSEAGSMFKDEAGKALKLEKTVAELERAIEGQAKKRGELSKAIARRSISDVRGAEYGLRDKLSSVQPLVLRFEEAAEALRRSVEESRNELREKLLSEEISEETYSLLEGELSQYDTYTASNRRRYDEIKKLPEKAERNMSALDDTLYKANKAYEYIRDWEPELIPAGFGPPLEEGGPSVPLFEEETLDEVSVWAPVVSAFSRYETMSMNMKSGIKDREKERQLENIGALLSQNIMRLVLPEGYSPETEPLLLEACPSSLSEGSEKDMPDDDASLLDRLFLTEYAVQMFNEYEPPDSEKEDGEKKHLEVEYVLCGKKSDAENLSAAATELLAVRTGLNLIHILKDSEKRSSASELSLSITGLASASPLSAVVCFLIMTVWALGQAVLDLRDLFGGEKVPVMHDRESFYLSLEGLLTDFAGMLKDTHENEKGLKYLSYLRILLFARMDRSSEYRMMDIIQLNLRKLQPDFLMERLYTSARFSVRAGSSHIFTGAFGKGGGYLFNVSTGYSY